MRAGALTVGVVNICTIFGESGEIADRIICIGIIVSACFLSVDESVQVVVAEVLCFGYEIVCYGSYIADFVICIA